MEAQTKIAFDLGGVIIERGLENRIIQQSLMSVKLTVQKFKANNVFVISKAKQKYVDRNLDLLRKQHFFDEAGLKEANVFFVREYEDKGQLGTKLGLKYIIDDSVKVAKIMSNVGITPILFGDHQEFISDNKEFINVKNWKGYRKLLQRLK